MAGFQNGGIPLFHHSSYFVIRSMVKKWHQPGQGVETVAFACGDANPYLHPIKRASGAGTGKARVINRRYATRPRLRGRG